MKLIKFIKRIRWNGYYRKPDYCGYTYFGKKFGCYNVKVNDPSTYAFYKWFIR